MTRNIALTLLSSLVLSFAVAAMAGAAVVQHYTFDTDFSDSSGNGDHGTPVDGNSDSDTNGVSITNTAGEFVFGGGAANFTDERDWVGVPSNTFGSGSPYSISFWARDLAPANQQGGMVAGRAGTTNFFLWLDGAPGGARWRSSNGVDANRNHDFSFSNDGEFHHYALLAGDFEDAGTGNNEVRLYRDGAIVGTGTGKQTGFIIDAIGEAYDTGLNLDFIGQIDEFWLFDETLDDATVQNLFQYNRLTAPPVPEPSTVVLAGLGMLGFVLRRHSRRR